MHFSSSKTCYELTGSRWLFDKYGVDSDTYRTDLNDERVANWHNMHIL